MLKHYKKVDIIKETEHESYQLMKKADQLYIMKKVPFLQNRKQLGIEIQRFKEVGGLLKQKDIPGVLPLSDVFVSERNIYAIREHIPGRSAQQIIDEGKVNLIDNDYFFVRRLFLSLTHMHNTSITHREINPKNIFIDSNQNSFIDTLGITRIVKGCDDNDNYYLRYTPPEVIEGKPHINYFISDIYSMGATLYHITKGSPPFTSSTNMSLITSICQENHESLGYSCTKAQIFSKMIDHTLVKNPRFRASDAQEFYKQLKRLESPEIQKRIQHADRVKIAVGLVAVCLGIGLEFLPEYLSKKAQENKKKVRKENQRKNAQQPVSKEESRIAKVTEGNVMKKIGDEYRYGKGRTLNTTSAFEWYQKAAEKGNTDAMNAIGNMYIHGKGVSKDYSKAIKWYQKAKQQGNYDSYAYIGYMYEMGYYFETNHPKAFELYQQGSEKNSSEAQVYLGRYYEKFKKIQPPNKYQAAFWYEKAANNNNLYGMAHLGRMYEEGEVKEKNIHRAIMWYNKSAAEKNPLALFYLARCYEKGLGVEKNRKKAHRYYEEAYEIGLNQKDYQQALRGIIRTK